jgi:hypothetical protein
MPSANRSVNLKLCSQDALQHCSSAGQLALLLFFSKIILQPLPLFFCYTCSCIVLQLPIGRAIVRQPLHVFSDSYN